MADENETDSTGTDEGTDDTGTGDSSGAGQEQGKTLTQADVDRILKREKAATERKTRQALADELGLSLDDVKRLIESQKAQDEAQKTEAQRAKDAADKARADADAATARARQSELKAELKTALLGGSDDEPPIRRDRIDRALQMLLPTLNGATGDDLSDAIADAVKGLRDELPEFFGAAGNGSGGSGTGTGTPGPGRKISERAGDGAGQKSRAEQMIEGRRAKNRMAPLPKH